MQAIRLTLLTPQYYDTTLSYIKHFLLQFVCGGPECSYTTTQTCPLNNRYLEPNFGVDSIIDVVTSVINIISDNYSLNIYPIPAKDYVKVDLRKLNGKYYTIEVFDHMGQLVRKYNEHDAAGEFIINRGDLVPGLYLVNINTKQSNYTGKILF